MAHEPVPTPSVFDSGRYSHVVRAGNTLYISGQVAMDKEGQVVGKGDFEAQGRQAYGNLQRVLRDAGGDLKNLVKVNMYITDGRFAGTNHKLRQEFFKPPLPAMTLVVVEGLAAPDFLIEVEGIAVLD
jgi:enamine deaminase RidA (YjgF/YER057c/UK114 family)